ncbi:putative meiotic recombination protein REC114 isoform 2 [Scophthalmus maximus]|uniref:Putative meiotic recombination protein REC114 n=1 Tax=Scophthalmus maximus TaxID=52904 RepID=A0A2U9BD02_SCOMX|nr:putative meiotic recombination protein REC114 [Scophthalmus maximus]AWP01878.1 putative meiotic recombination protein REC114 isoform 2 [Scophthalmus maximus]
MAPRQRWKLKRYGRVVPGSREEGGMQPWEVFEANGGKPEIVLTIVEPGYMLVLQGQESLDTIPLLCGSDFLRVHQKSDNLMFRVTVEGESRMIRMQFEGSCRAEAVKECSSAVDKLTEYMPVTTQDQAPPSHNQPPADVSAPGTQGTEVGVEPEVVQGSLSIKRLIEHFLGETAMTLPQVYHHCPLAQGDMEPILRVCLLDPSFHLFVENVECELRKLHQE